MNFEPSFIKRTDSSQWRPSIRRLPTDNRDLARQHEALIYRRINRRGLAISVFAFSATLFTLLWFSLTHSSFDTIRKAPQAALAASLQQEDLSPDAAIEDSALADIPDPDEIAVAPGFVEATGRPAAPDEDEYRDFYAAGDQAADWLGSFHPDRVLWTGHH